MTAQVPASGHSENFEVLSCAAGQPSLVLSPISETAAKVLGDAFAAIDPWARYPYPASALTIYFATVEPQAPRYAIHAADKLVGAIGLRLNWLHGPYIQFLGLLPGQQGLGLGGRLLSWCEESARSRGARNLWVAASDFNTDAMRFYERFGFGRITELEGLVLDDRNEVLFRKRLF